MPRVIPPAGPEDAEIYILGEAPGAKEDQEGQAFVGPSGKLMWSDIFARAHIWRKDCRVANVYWERPPGNDFKKLEDDHEYWEDTKEDIVAHPRKFIIAVGEKALQFLTGQVGITSWRGSILRDIPIEVNGNLTFVTVLPMVHPAAVLRQFSLLVLCRHDARRAQRLLATPSLAPPSLEILQFAEALRRHGDSEEAVYNEYMDTLDAYMGAPCLAFDIETYAETITCLGLARSNTHSIVIPLTGEFAPSREAALLQKAKRVLEGPALKIGQNLDYDVQYLMQVFNIGVRNVWMDTMVAHSCMHPELAHSLALLTSMYTLHPYYKEMRKEAETGNYSEQMWRYNGIDCCVTFEVGCALLAELEGTGVREFFEDRSMRVTKTLIRMEFRGVLVDASLRDTRRKGLEESVEKLLTDKRLQGVNPNSPKQVKEYFTEHGTKLPRAKGKDSPSTDETSLKLLRQKHPQHEDFIDAILQVRAERKIISTYLNAKAHDDGRMRTSYRTSSTDTGRISSSRDVFNKGMNLQNVPVDQRDWFIPDKGLVFWAADSSQIEARITAYLAQDEDYIRAYIEERDIHSENAAAMFRFPVDKKTLIPGTTVHARDVGKTATHAMNYMVGPRTLQRMLNADFPEVPFTYYDAQTFIATFKGLYPGVVSWWGRIIDHLRRNRIMRNPYGRRRIFLERYNEQLFKAAVANLPQSTAADHINGALVEIEADLESIPQADVLLQTHDEIAGQCLVADVPRIKDIVVSRMQEPIPILYEELPLCVPADFSTGPNWKDTHG